LTGANQRVGNWPGVTVDRKEGSYRYGDKTVKVVDLPGIYAIDAEDDGSIDEAIARDYLLSGEAQVVVDIVDASNLERNLYLTTQILEMGVPLVVALNMTDVAQEHGTRVNPKTAVRRLGLSGDSDGGFSNEGVEELRCVWMSFWRPQAPKAQVVYPSVIEEALAVLTPAIAACPSHRPRSLDGPQAAGI
jgi:ferrous iron transport protein B